MAYCNCVLNRSGRIKRRSSRLWSSRISKNCFWNLCWVSRSTRRRLSLQISGWADLTWPLKRDRTLLQGRYSQWAGRESNDCELLGCEVRSLLSIRNSRNWNYDGTDTPESRMEIKILQGPHRWETVIRLRTWGLKSAQRGIWISWMVDWSYGVP